MADALDSSTLHADNGDFLVRVGISMICLSAIAVVMRFVARRLANQPVQWDDWLVLMALPAAWGVGIAEIVAVDVGGFGQHLKFQKVEAFLKCVYAVTFLYIVALGLTKYSIIFFYRRIFRISAVKVPLYILGGFLTAFLLSAAIVCIVPCVPVRGFWDKSISSKCYDELKFFWVVSIPNIISDFLIFVFPLPLVWSLQLRVSQKIAVTSILVIGGFIMVISAVRTVSLYRVQKNPDVTWILLPAGVWNVVECNVAVILACLPSMGPLLRLILGERSTALRVPQYSSKRGWSSRYKWSQSTTTSGGKRSSFARMKHLQIPVNSIETNVNSDSTHLPAVEYPQPVLAINVSSEIYWESHPRCLESSLGTS